MRTTMETCPSLLNEIIEVQHTVEAARLLADLRRLGNWPTERDREQLPSRISATLGLLGERLRLVARVLRQEVDPRLLVAPFNVVVPERENVFPELHVLEPWSPAARTRNARREMGCAQHELRGGKQRQRGRSARR